MAIRSLFNLCIEKVALQLWSQPPVLRVMELRMKFRKDRPLTVSLVGTRRTRRKFWFYLEPRYDYLWREITGLLKLNASKIPGGIPLTLERILCNTMHFISDIIAECIELVAYFDTTVVKRNEFRFFLSRLLHNCVVTGVHDEDIVSTAKSMVADIQLSLKLRFEIAIQYCLKDEIFKLWRDMDIDTKKQCCYRYKYIITTRLTDFWILWVKKTTKDEAYCPSRNKFNLMLKFINSKEAYFMANSAKRYFWENATAVQRERLLQIFLVNSRYSPLLDGFHVPYFIFRQLNHQQLRMLLDDNPYALLSSIALHQNTDHSATDLFELCVSKIPDDKFGLFLYCLAFFSFSSTFIENVWETSSMDQQEHFFDGAYRLKVFQVLEQYCDYRLLDIIYRARHELYSVPMDSEFFWKRLKQGKWAILKNACSNDLMEYRYEEDGEIDEIIIEARNANMTLSELARLLNEFDKFETLDCNYVESSDDWGYGYEI